MLTRDGIEVDLEDGRWAEAYAEMEFYNESASKFGEVMGSTLTKLNALRGTPAWSTGWLDAPYDATSQLEALQFLDDPSGRRALQLGGKGNHVARALIGGAAEAWLVTPMLSEALYALELMERLGFSERFRAVVGVAEEMPLPDSSFDTMYAGGCLHHMAAEYAAPEIYRVLAPGGRFAAIEPWQTLLHKYGTKLVGKREANAYCRPLNHSRLSPLKRTFQNLEIHHHGPVLRYLALALFKLTKREISPRIGLRLTGLDDLLPIPKRFGGSVAVLAGR